MTNEFDMLVSTASYKYVLQDLATKKFYKLNRWSKDELINSLTKLTGFISPEQWKSYIKKHNLTNVRIIPLRIEHRAIYKDAEIF